MTDTLRNNTQPFLVTHILQLLQRLDMLLFTPLLPHPHSAATNLLHPSDFTEDHPGEKVLLLLHFMTAQHCPLQHPLAPVPLYFAKER